MCREIFESLKGGKVYKKGMGMILHHAGGEDGDDEKIKRRSLFAHSRNWQRLHSVPSGIGEHC